LFVVASTHSLIVVATMPNNRRSTLKKIKGKETVHPGSRKGEHGATEAEQSDSS
jgi:hypothetical protein